MYRASHARWFEFAIMAAIIANTLLLAVTYYGRPPAVSAALEDANAAFTALYTVEALIKVVLCVVVVGCVVVVVRCLLCAGFGRVRGGRPTTTTTTQHAQTKIGGLGWRHYWRVGWNRLDAALLVSSLADLLVSRLLGGAVSNVLKVQKVMRLMRLARVLKLIRGLKVCGSVVCVALECVLCLW